jgi:S-formylglutathione hydrolase FrmB
VRLVALLAAALLAVSAAPAAASELRTFELPSPLVDPSTPGGRLDADRTVPAVNVLLPDGYDDRGKRRYPVLWLLHGGNGGADSWLSTQKLRELSAGMEAILVMPDGGRFGMYADWLNGGARGGPAWVTYHLGALRREIESRYRILKARRWHAIAGISMGGQGALRYAAMLPGYFGSAVSISAAFPETRATEAQKVIDELSTATPLAEGVSYDAIFGSREGAYAEGNSPQALVANYAHTRIYLTSGDATKCPEDPVPAPADAFSEYLINSQQGPFAAAARARGAELTERTTCGVHAFWVFDRAFAAARAWDFFGPVPKRPRKWSYRTIATSGEMWGLRFRFKAPPAKPVKFKRAAGKLTGKGRGFVRIRGRGGCRLKAKLPFRRPLPRRCARLDPGGSR